MQISILAALWLGLGGVLTAATSLHLGPSGGNANDSVSVPLEIRSTDNVTAIQFDITYDSAVVTIDDVMEGPSASGHMLDFETVSDGLTRVVVVSETNTAFTDGDVAEIELTLASSVAMNTASIGFSNVILSDTTGTQVTIIWAPYIGIISPMSGMRFSNATQVGLTAVAVDYTGTITSVEFFADGQSIALDSTAPYTATWSATGSGDIVLTAIAISSGGGQTTSLGVDLVVAPPPSEAWFDGFFTPGERSNPAIGGILGDPDLDKIPNLMEYALGLNPRSFDTDGLPELEIVYVGPDGYTGLRYRANPEADDIDFTVEVSSELGAWLSGDMITEVVSSELVEGKQEVLVRDLKPLINGTPESRLLRLTVSLNGQ